MRTPKVRLRRGNKVEDFNGEVFGKPSLKYIDKVPKFNIKLSDGTDFTKPESFTVSDQIKPEDKFNIKSKFLNNEEVEKITKDIDKLRENNQNTLYQNNNTINTVEVEEEELDDEIEINNECESENDYVLQPETVNEDEFIDDVEISEEEYDKNILPLNDEDQTLTTNEEFDEALDQIEEYQPDAQWFGYDEEESNYKKIPKQYNKNKDKYKGF